MSVADSETPPKVAEKVADPAGGVLTVLIVNAAEVCPAAILTVAGAVALDEELCNVTASPPTGAGLVIFTVPVDDPPGATVVGVRVRDVSAGGVIASIAVLDTFPFLAVIVAKLWTVTAVVVTENVTEEEPAGTVTVLGIKAAEMLLERETTKPPV